jgi:hypothetical protein
LMNSLLRLDNSATRSSLGNVALIAASGTRNGKS